MRFSLRTRVLAATLLLVTLGLAAAGVATYTLLHRSLITRLDDQLRAARFPVLHDLADESRPGPPGDGPGPGTVIPVGTYAAVLDRSGNVIAETTYGYGSPATTVRPELPSGLPGSAAAGPGATDRIFSADAIPSGPSYRVVAAAFGVPPDDVRGTVVVAMPLTEVNSTLHRLLYVEAAVAAAVLLAVGLLSWWLVRLGLRPLDRMAVTAGSIAGGDLSKRVEPEDDRTEVGRLGLALNTMLGQIETSFEEQRRSEARLRRFVADASHELRTPLTSIRGYAELFRHGAADRPEDLERAMRRIEDEGARMGVLVDDLLLLARLDQGRPLDRDDVDLSRIVGDAVHDARAADPERPVDASIADGVVVPGDDLRLSQVLANLMDNARTHTPSGTPVSVRLTASNGTATVEVADRGPGMSEEETGRAFERFYRGDPSRSRGSGGTGLGLSIAWAIVEAHGGTISVSSGSGEGTTFRIDLPASDGDAAPSPG